MTIASVSCYMFKVNSVYLLFRACLAYRLQSRPIKNKIIAKLGIIYTTWLYKGVLSILSLPQQSTYMYRPINTAWVEREDGERASQLPQLATTN